MLRVRERMALEVAFWITFSPVLLVLLVFLPVMALAAAVPALREMVLMAAVAAAAATVPAMVFLALELFLDAVVALAAPRGSRYSISLDSAF